MKNDQIRDDILVPLNKNDLTVLAWFAEWTPEIHKAAWGYRRRWPPGYRAIADVSTHNHKKHEKARADKSFPPVLVGEETDRFGGGGPTAPTLAKGRYIPKLLTYGMLEGTWNCARLTGRGRAALKLNGRDCPDFFESHDGGTIFDDHDLLPQKGINIKINFDDTTMGRIPEVYKETGYKGHLPDDETTWRIWLAEYQDKDYMGWSSNNRCAARLSVTSGQRPLNGSLRLHTRYPTLHVEDGDGRTVVELAMSFEQLAEILVGQGSTPVTLDYYWDRDGMQQQNRVPPPVSISRRVKERVKRGAQDAHGWINEAAELLNKAKMGKKAKAEIIDKLGLAIRDTGGLGAFAAQQALEEVSMVGESMLTIMSERIGANPHLLGQPVTTNMLLGSPELPTDRFLESKVECGEGEGSPSVDVLTDLDDEVEAAFMMDKDGRMLSRLRQADGTEQWVPSDVVAETISMLTQCEEYAPSDHEVKLAAAFMKASVPLPWDVALDVTRVLKDGMDWK